MLFGKKNDETLEQKIGQLKKLRGERRTVEVRLEELDTTQIATLTHDGNVIGALSAQRLRDQMVAALKADQSRLDLEISKLETELKASQVPCPNSRDHMLYPFQIKQHLADTRKLADPTKCAVLM